MQIVFLHVPCEFLLRNSWPELNYENLNVMVHNDPTIDEFMNPVLHRHQQHGLSPKRLKMARTRNEEVQMLRDSMEEKLRKSLADNIPPQEP